MKLLNMQQNQSLGQVWTPDNIATSMLDTCFKINPKIRTVLDPACGPGTFSAALDRLCRTDVSLFCYDIDVRMVEITKGINDTFGLKGDTKLRDYLKYDGGEEKFDLIIMNPPYIRQEKISKKDKEQYLSFLSTTLGEQIDKRSNLFALFLLKGIVDLKKDGLLCAIVYDAIQHTSYGKKTLSLLDSYCELISEKHVFAPFSDAMVDAKILIYRKRDEKKLTSEIKINETDGLVDLEQLVETRRGTGFALRKLFIAESSEPVFSLSSPFFIKQAKLNGMIIEPDSFAYFIDDKDCDFNIVKDWLDQKADLLNFDLKKYKYPKVIGDIVFNYYIRDKPRHLWNPSQIPVSDNFYVANVKGDFPPQVAWLLLNSDCYLSPILLASRNQGNGLLKIQLFEYKKVRVPDWRLIPQHKIEHLKQVAESLLSKNADYSTVKNVSNSEIKGIFNE